MAAPSVNFGSIKPLPSTDFELQIIWNVTGATDCSNERVGLHMHAGCAVLEDLAKDEIYNCSQMCKQVRSQNCRKPCRIQGPCSVQAQFYTACQSLLLLYFDTTLGSLRARHDSSQVIPPTGAPVHVSKSSCSGVFDQSR